MRRSVTKTLILSLMLILGLFGQGIAATGETSPAPLSAALCTGPDCACIPDDAAPGFGLATAGKPVSLLSGAETFSRTVLNPKLST